MAGSKKCEPGCSCAKHSKLTTEEREQRRREQSRESMSRWRERNPGHGRKAMTEEEREASRQRRLEKAREYARLKRANDPEYRERQRERQRIHGRRYSMKHNFGITLEEWNEMIIEQTGRCYLCEDPLTGQIDVDHNHKCCPGRRSCGRCIRGLACRWCNQGLGQFRDDPERMRRAADALEKAELRISAQNN